MARHDMQDQDTDWRTPDIDAGQRIAAADLERIAAKLEKAELALLVEGISRHIAAKRKGKEEAVARFISEAITFCVFPSPCMVNVMGLAYALDLPFHMGRSMSAQARSMGVTRAAISNAAWQFTRRMKIPPSRWLRTEGTTENNRKARLKACKPETP
jgi:hypothetical protein